MDAFLEEIQFWFERDQITLEQYQDLLKTHAGEESLSQLRQEADWLGWQLDAHQITSQEYLRSVSVAAEACLNHPLINIVRASEITQQVLMERDLQTPAQAARQTRAFLTDLTS